jgi:DMSO reductase anchor subunit
MLVLTQLSVGAFVVELVRQKLVGAIGFGRFQAAIALALCLVAMGASVLHLGRPLYAFRAVLGMRTSWLSREIAVFSLFAALAAGYAASFVVGAGDAARSALLWLVAGSGVVGVGCSVMVYEATRRTVWRAQRVTPTFFASTVLLGCAAVLAIDAVGGRFVPGLGTWLAVATSAKLTGEAMAFGHLRSRRHTTLKRRALLMARELRHVTTWRFACGITGGVLLPLAAAAVDGIGRAIVAVAALALVLAGELCERHLFFAAAPAPRMPGAPA